MVILRIKNDNAFLKYLVQVLALYFITSVVFKNQGDLHKWNARKNTFVSRQ